MLKTYPVNKSVVHMRSHEHIQIQVQCQTRGKKTPSTTRGISEQSLLFPPCKHDLRCTFRILLENPMARLDRLGRDIVTESVLTGCHGEGVRGILRGGDVKVRRLDARVYVCVSAKERVVSELTQEVVALV